MIIAKEKRKTNIAEYILYMWQIEDLIRAYGFNIDRIENEYISRFQGDDKLKLEIRDWYNNLLLMMEKERIQQNGHLQFIKNLVTDLNDFHLKLIETGKDPQYSILYQQTNPLISEFAKKTGDENASDIETCLSGLYSLMLLRLQKKEISQSTLLSIQSFGKLMAHMSVRYKQYEDGDLEF